MTDLNQLKPMKRMISVFTAAILFLFLSACSEQKLADMTRADHGDYAAIVWEDKTYVPYCIVSKRDCGAQIGIVDGDKGDSVYAYKDYPADAWIINYFAADNIAMLYRESDNADIPEGLHSEYEWNP